MKELKKYIEEIIGIYIEVNPIPVSRLGSLPLYILEGYQFYQTDFMSREILIVELKEKEEFSILQLAKHQEILKEVTRKAIVFVFDDLPAFNRKRLIEKRVNFIVPGKQLYIPEFLMDLRESFNRTKSKKEKEKLIPTAQFLLLYHLLNQNNHSIDERSFKVLAEKLGYTPMAISKAVDNLKNHDLIEVTGSKEKQIHFELNRSEIWNIANKQELWINPVVRRVYVDELPKQSILKSNTSALPEYTDMNPSRQLYYAIEKTAFYALQRNKELENINEYEGKYCLELWQYNPVQLVEGMNNELNVVDPLSLYLSLKEEKDERIEMALEQIIEKYIW
jgi:hypothetical protein